MRTLAIAAFVFLLQSPINAFELPFKLPFNLPFLKGPSPELFALHKELVNIPSVTGSEHDVGLFLENYLRERNYTVERIPSN